jgi:hypothetical protein
MLLHTITVIKAYDEGDRGILKTMIGFRRDKQVIS